MRQLTQYEKEMLWAALNVRNNHIETGTVSMSAADVARFGDETNIPDGAKIRALSDDQMRLLIASREMISKIISGKIMINE
jgi:hypothetical protein